MTVDKQLIVMTKLYWPGLQLKQVRVQNDRLKYEGLRFRAECRLAGRLYGQPFGVDVAFGDPILREQETVTVDDVLGFAGIALPTVRLYPVETHIAEKLHAYTMPRARPNTRVKDLPDIALLATTRTLAASRLRLAFERTFEFRATRLLPSSLPEPSDNWSLPYREMAGENELVWARLEELSIAAKGFLDPILANERGIWDPTKWVWKTHHLQIT